MKPRVGGTEGLCHQTVGRQQVVRRLQRQPFVAQARGVPAIPAQAIRRERGRNVVYVLTDSRPRRREVKVGWRDGQWVEIVDGLAEGQTVLLEPPPAAAGQSEERP